MPRFPSDAELPEELHALRALVGDDDPELRRGRRSEQATRSASVYLAERRRRLRRELASDVDDGVPEGRRYARRP